MSLEIPIDLHIHSNHSDGSDSPQEILTQAEKLNLKIIALTDHDAISGTLAMLKLNPTNIKIIPGIELETTVPQFQRTVHILGYGMNKNLTGFQKKLEVLQMYRWERNVKMIQKLQSLGLSIDIKELCRGIPNSAGKKDDDVLKSAGRPHLADYLIQKGYCSNFYQVFAEYLSETTGKAYIPKKSASVEDSIALIHQFGGKAFLAHPNALQLEDSKMDLLIQSLKQTKLDGVEIYNSSIKKYKYSCFLKKLTQKHQLLFSGGSDYHGKFKKNIHLGQICQDKKIKKITTQNVSAWFVENFWNNGTTN